MVITVREKLYVKSMRSVVVTSRVTCTSSGGHRVVKLMFLCKIPYEVSFRTTISC